MQFEKLYTKYKFNKQELTILTGLFKTTPDLLENKLDKMTYDERRAAYTLMNMMIGKNTDAGTKIFSNLANIQGRKLHNKSYR